MSRSEEGDALAVVTVGHRECSLVLNTSTPISERVLPGNWYSVTPKTVPINTMSGLTLLLVVCAEPPEMRPSSNE